MVPNFSTAKQSSYTPFVSPGFPFPQRKSNNILLYCIPSSSSVPLSLLRWLCFLLHRKLKFLDIHSLSSQIHTHLFFSSDFGGEIPALSCFSLIPAAVLRTLFLILFLVKAVGVLPLSGIPLFPTHASLYQHIHARVSPNTQLPQLIPHGTWKVMLFPLLPFPRKMLQGVFLAVHASLSPKHPKLSFTHCNLIFTPTPPLSIRSLMVIVCQI